MGSKIPQPPPKETRGQSQPKSPPPPPKKSLTNNNDDLTIARIYGYHSRDPEVWGLEKRVQELESSEKWNSPETLPEDGLAIVILVDDYEHEYYGDPVVVNCHQNKLKTTVDPLRIEREDVKAWRPCEEIKRNI